jgi:predicted Zn-dependent protease
MCGLSTEGVSTNRNWLNDQTRTDVCRRRRLKVAMSPFRMRIVLSIALPLLLIDSREARAQGNPGPMVVSPAQEVAWGEEAFHKFLTNHQRSTNADLAIRVDRIGRSVARVSERPDHPYVFVVVQGKELQAYSFPGGTVCVTEGLVRLYQSDDELAFALGHELSHIVLRHHISKRQVQEALKSGAPGAEALLAAVQSKFDRDSEMEADRYGALYAVRANYRFTGAISGLEHLSLGTKKEDADHSPFAERIAALNDFNLELNRCLDAFSKGVSAIQSSDAEQAILLFRLFVSEFPNSFAGRVNLGTAYFVRMRSHSGTPENLAEALPMLPDPGIKLREPIDTSDAEHARENYEIALRYAQPGDSIIQAATALVYARLGNLAESRRLLKEALAAEPSSPELLLCLGNVEFLDGNPTGAAALYHQSLSARSEWPLARKNLAMAYEKMPGKQSEALTLWKSLVGDKDLDTEARLHLSVAP